MSLTGHWHGSVRLQLMGDVTKWIVIYFFLLMGFSQAVMIAVQQQVMVDPDLADILELGATGISLKTTELSTMDCLKYYTFVTLGDVSQPMVWAAGRNNSYIWMLHVVFLILSTLVCMCACHFTRARARTCTQTVRICVCVCVTCTHARARAREHTHTHARTHARTHIHAYAHARTHARTHARAHAHPAWVSEWVRVAAAN